MKFVIDMMGGDHGVETTIGAVKEFLKLHDDVYFYCVGNVECLSPLEGLDRVTIVPSIEVLKMDVDPMEAMHKKDSSLNIAMETYLKENCDCLVSAGSTGALVSEGVFKIKRIPITIKNMFKILVKLKSAEEFKFPDLTVVDVTL